MEASRVQRRIEALERAAEAGRSTRASPAAGPAINVPVQAVRRDVEAIEADIRVAPLSDSRERPVPPGTAFSTSASAPRIRDRVGGCSSRGPGLCPRKGCIFVLHARLEMP